MKHKKKTKNKITNKIIYNGHAYVLADGIDGINNSIKILQTACKNYSETNSMCTEACPLYYQCHEEAIANWPPVVCATCTLSMDERDKQKYPCEYCKLDPSELAKKVNTNNEINQKVSTNNEINQDEDPKINPFYGWEEKNE